MFFTETPIQQLIRSGFPLLLGCALGATAQNAVAIGLSDIHIESFLGEPFSATVRILGDDAKDTHADCYTAQPQANSQNFDLLPIAGIKIEFRRPPGNQAPQLQLRTMQPITEPMARVAIQAGCGTSLAREYVVMLSPRVYEESLIDPNPVTVPVASKPPLEPATSTALPAMGSTSGTASTEAPTTSTPPTATRQKPAPSKATADLAVPAKENGRQKTARSAPAARQAKSEGDRLVIAPLNVAAMSAPPLPQKKINLTTSKLAAAEQEIGVLKSELERAEETRQKEIQALQALEVHIISLQKEMADLKLQIQHKDALERQLLAQVSQSKLKLFSEDSTSKSIGSPTEFFWMLIIAGGIGGLSAFGTYSALKRQKGDKWA